MFDYNNVEYCWICYLELLGIMEVIKIKMVIILVVRRYRFLRVLKIRLFGDMVD